MKRLFLSICLLTSISCFGQGTRVTGQGNVSVIPVFNLDAISNLVWQIIQSNLSFTIDTNISLTSDTNNTYVNTNSASHFTVGVKTNPTVKIKGPGIVLGTNTGFTIVSEDGVNRFRVVELADTTSFGVNVPGLTPQTLVYANSLKFLSSALVGGGLTFTNGGLTNVDEINISTNVIFQIATTASSNSSPDITISSKGTKNNLSHTTNDGAMFGPDTPGTTTCGIQEAWNLGVSVVGSNGPVVNGFTLRFRPGYFFYTNKLIFWQTNVSSAKLVGSSLMDTKLVYAGTGSNVSCILFTNSWQDDLGFQIGGHLWVEDMGFTALEDYVPKVLVEARNIGGSRWEHLNFTGWQIMTNRTLGDGASVSIAQPATLYPPGLVGLWLNTGGGDHGNFIQDIYCADVACGIVAFCDHITLNGFRTAWLGGIGSTGGTNAWPDTSIFSLGAAIIDAVNLDGLWSYMHMYRAKVGIAKYSSYAPDSTPFGGSTTFDHVNFENTVYPVISDGGNNAKIVLRDLPDDSINCTNLNPLFFSINGAAGFGEAYPSNKFSIVSNNFTELVLQGSGGSRRGKRMWYVGDGRQYTMDIYTNGDLTFNGGSFTNKATNIVIGATKTLTNWMNNASGVGLYEFFDGNASGNPDWGLFDNTASTFPWIRAFDSNNPKNAGGFPEIDMSYLWLFKGLTLTNDAKLGSTMVSGDTTGTAGWNSNLAVFPNGNLRIGSGMITNKATNTVMGTLKTSTNWLNDVSDAGIKEFRDGNAAGGPEWGFIDNTHPLHPWIRIFDADNSVNLSYPEVQMSYLYLNHGLTLSNGAGNGKVLTSDANGVATWQTGGSGGGFTGNPNQFDSANGTTNIISGALFTNITMRPASGATAALTLKGITGGSSDLLAVRNVSDVLMASINGETGQYFGRRMRLSNDNDLTVALTLSNGISTATANLVEMQGTNGQRLIVDAGTSLALSGGSGGVIVLQDTSPSTRIQLGTNDNLLLTNTGSGFTIQMTNGNYTGSGNITNLGNMMVSNVMLYPYDVGFKRRNSSTIEAYDLNGSLKSINVQNIFASGDVESKSGYYLNTNADAVLVIDNVNNHWAKAMVITNTLMVGSNNIIGSGNIFQVTNIFSINTSSNVVDTGSLRVAGAQTNDVGTHLWGASAAASYMYLKPQSFAELHVRKNGWIGFSDSSSDATSAGHAGLYGGVASGVLQFMDNTDNAALMWFNWGGQARLTTNMTSTGTSLANINMNRIVTVISGRAYKFRLVLFFNMATTAADGIKIDFNGGSAGSTTFRAHGHVYGTTSGFGAQVTGLTGTIGGVALSTDDETLTVEGYFVPSGNGTLRPRFAKNANAAGATLTLYAGSNFEVFDVP